MAEEDNGFDDDEEDDLDEGDVGESEAEAADASEAEGAEGAAEAGPEVEAGPEEDEDEAQAQSIAEAEADALAQAEADALAQTEEADALARAQAEPVQVAAPLESFTPIPQQPSFRFPANIAEALEPVPAPIEVPLSFTKEQRYYIGELEKILARKLTPDELAILSGMFRAGRLPGSGPLTPDEKQELGVLARKLGRPLTKEEIDRAVSLRRQEDFRSVASGLTAPREEERGPEPSFRGEGEELPPFQPPTSTPTPPGQPPSPGQPLRPAGMTQEQWDAFLAQQAAFYARFGIQPPTAPLQSSSPTPIGGFGGGFGPGPTIPNVPLLANLQERGGELFGRHLDPTTMLRVLRDPTRLQIFKSILSSMGYDPDSIVADFMEFLPGGRTKSPLSTFV